MNNLINKKKNLGKTFDSIIKYATLTSLPTSDDSYYDTSMVRNSSRIGAGVGALAGALGGYFLNPYKKYRWLSALGLGVAGGLGGLAVGDIIGNKLYNNRFVNLDNGFIQMPKEVYDYLVSKYPAFRERPSDLLMPYGHYRGHFGFTGEGLELLDDADFVNAIRSGNSSIYDIRGNFIPRIQQYGFSPTGEQLSHNATYLRFIGKNNPDMGWFNNPEIYTNASAVKDLVDRLESTGDSWYDWGNPNSENYEKQLGLVDYSVFSPSMKPYNSNPTPTPAYNPTP